MESTATAEKPKSIHTLGVGIMAFSGFIMFTNAMGAITWTLLEVDTTDAGTGFGAIIMTHYIDLCLCMVLLGGLYFFGGLFISRYRLWANRLVTVVSGALALIIWITMFILRSLAPSANSDNFEFSRDITIVVAVIWTIPLAALIWLLNRSDVVKYFR